MSLEALLWCCGLGRKRHKELDETTRLLDPESLPPAQPPAAQGVKSSDEELRHQNDLRNIVQHASERIISINAPTPLLHVRPGSPQLQRKISIESASSAMSTGPPNGRLERRNPPGPEMGGSSRTLRAAAETSLHSLRTLNQHGGPVPNGGRKEAADSPSAPRVSDHGSESQSGTVHSAGATEESTSQEAANGLDMSIANLSDNTADDDLPPLLADLLDVAADEDIFMSKAVTKIEAVISQPFDLGSPGD